MQLAIFTFNVDVRILELMFHLTGLDFDTRVGTWAVAVFKIVEVANYKESGKIISITSSMCYFHGASNIL